MLLLLPLSFFVSALFPAEQALMVTALSTLFPSECKMSHCGCMNHSGNVVKKVITVVTMVGVGAGVVGIILVVRGSAIVVAVVVSLVVSAGVVVVVIALAILPMLLSS